MDLVEDAVIDRDGLDALIGVLSSSGLRTRGPIVRDAAIVHDEVTGVDDLPAPGPTSS